MPRAENGVQHEHTLTTSAFAAFAYSIIGYASCSMPVTHLTRTVPGLLFAISLNFHTMVLFLFPQASLQMTLFKPWWLSSVSGHWCDSAGTSKAPGTLGGASVPTCPPLHQLCIVYSLPGAGLKPWGEQNLFGPLTLSILGAASQDLGGIHHSGCLEAGWSQGTCLSS